MLNSKQKVEAFCSGFEKVAFDFSNMISPEALTAGAIGGGLGLAAPHITGAFSGQEEESKTPQQAGAELDQINQSQGQGQGQEALTEQDYQNYYNQMLLNELYNQQYSDSMQDQQMYYMY